MAMLESGEMYLETIHVLSQKSASVRSIDVAEEMGFSRPSVSRAMGILKKDGFIEIDGQGFIKLTEKGEKQAMRIYERHVLLTDLFERIGVSKETAEEDACRIEHYLSDETFEAIKARMKLYEK
ncbi:MAG: metal-dependent transcriptional regulator [Firmicutes bacterium]|jgi:Mn-dependent DtxR family transcriptional regulator|nr:metal-dependent transcriptional regulator [Bacillota bacterium]